MSANISDGLFSLAHYYEQNGDLVPDPDMVFLRTMLDDGRIAWAPKELTLAIGRHVSAFSVDERGRPSRADSRLYRQLVDFARMWLRNIRAQQEIPAAAGRPPA